MRKWTEQILIVELRAANLLVIWEGYEPQTCSNRQQSSRLERHPFPAACNCLSVYNTLSFDTDSPEIQDHWVSELCPSSGILNTRKHNLSVTAIVPVLRSREGDIHSVWSLKKFNLNE
jgi:hypothetical protein